MIANVLTLSAVCAGAYFLYKWFREVGSAADAAFREAVLSDAAGWISERVGGSPAEVSAALGGLVDRGEPHPLLSKLLGLECEVTKLSATAARRTVVVMVDGGAGQAIVGRIARDVDFDEVPESVRGDFIRLGGETHTFRIIGPHSGNPKGTL